MTGPRRDSVRSKRTGRRLALAAVFEADFGQRTARAVLERHLAEIEGDPGAAELAREVVETVGARRHTIDAKIQEPAPGHPLGRRARSDRGRLRGTAGGGSHAARRSP